MKLYEITYPIQPNEWSCLPTACACLLQTQPNEVIEAIGHDGSEILFDGHGNECGKRGFHVDEIFDVFIANLRFPVPIEAEPQIHIDDLHWSVFGNPHSRLNHYLENHCGILLGSHPDTDKPHAVVWDGEQVYDPRGQCYPVARFQIDCFLALF
jgi:hypothetical protein